MLDESAFREARLCVVGNINRDIKTAPIAPGDQLFSDGETSIGALHETIGGGGANSAAIAARLGAEVSFIGQIGDDALGVRLEQAMESIGVRCHLRRAAGLATGSTVNLVFNTGQRHFLSWLPNNAALAPDSLDLSSFRDARHLLRADVWFSDAMLFGGNEKLFRTAREAGLAVSLDLNWDPQWGRASRSEIERRKRAIREVLPLVDLAHGNVRELNEFTGSDDLMTSLRLLVEWGTGAVVVHQGEAGAGYFVNGHWVVEKPVPAARRVAVTGTGDVLSVCLMLLHHRRDIEVKEKLQLANGIVTEFIEGRRLLIPVL